MVLPDRREVVMIFQQSSNTNGFNKFFVYNLYIDTSFFLSSFNKKVVETNMIKTIILSIILLSVTVLAQSNPYLVEFNKLPSSYHHYTDVLVDNGERNMGTKYRDIRNNLVNKYSWAVPNRDAIEAIAEFTGGSGLIDFGAGSGYWASLIANEGIDVIAVDNWTDDKPDKLWYDVQTGSYEYLKFAGSMVLMMVWIPQYTDMGVIALKTWDGERLIVIGEPAPARSNANPTFFAELEKNWILIKVVDIPQWYNHNDAVFFYERVIR